IDFAPPHAIEHGFALEARGHVPIEARDAGLREGALQERLYPFRAGSLLCQAIRAALGARSGEAHVKVAIVTDEPVAAGTVQGERDRAAPTFEDVAALLAD